MQRDLLFVPSKRDYVMGRRPDVPCILCAVLKGDERVVSLVVERTRSALVSYNLYPYNPGHLIVFPRRHITDPRRLTPRERETIDTLVDRSLDILDGIYSPAGYNIGYNIGGAAGASMEHLHLHIVPRFTNEVGFIDIVGGARVHVDDPSTAAERIARAFSGKRPRRR